MEGLRRPCFGRPRTSTVEGYLARTMDGRHPVTKQWFSECVPSGALVAAVVPHTAVKRRIRGKQPPPKRSRTEWPGQTAETRGNSGLRPAAEAPPEKRARSGGAAPPTEARGQAEPRSLTARLGQVTRPAPSAAERLEALRRRVRARLG